jgi:CDP-diacylglycerol--glycerol-3-phosphate 3-phosphatidyltransferase
VDTFTPVTPSAAEALAPLLGLVGFLLSTLLYYSIKAAIFGRKREAYIENRQRSILAKLFQEWWIWLWTPVERFCLRLRLSPDAITTAATFVVALSAVLIASGHFSSGGWVFLAGSSFDFIDGRVARATGRVSRAGAFLDSTLDRVGELFVFGGLAVAYRQSWVLFAALLAAGAATLVSYARARGEAVNAGDTVKIGGMQRPERIVLTGIPCALSPISDLLFGAGAGRSVVAGALTVLAVLTTLTAIRRTWSIYHALRLQDPTPAQPPFRLADVFGLESARSKKKAAR